MNLIRYITERRKADRDELARRARAEAEQRGERPTYAVPSCASRRRYWK